MSKTDSIAITPKLILSGILLFASPIAGGIWFLSDLSSRLSSLEDSVSSIPSSDNSAILERIATMEINGANNKESIEKINADIDKMVEHVDKSFKVITDNLNSNPLSLGN